jgi:ribosomal protein S18 acetylase RimI-like enzyme
MIQLRTEQASDSLFVQKVYRTTREDELSTTNWSEQQKLAFVTMQALAQMAEYKKNYPGASFQIILYKRKPAGRFYTWENEHEIRLVDITLLPQFRNKGIGKSLLQDLIKKSNRLKKIISLHVEQDNRAYQLYLRMGFVYVKTNGRHYYMERKQDAGK